MSTGMVVGAVVAVAAVGGGYLLWQGKKKADAKKLADAAAQKAAEDMKKRPAPGADITAMTGAAAAALSTILSDERVIGGMKDVAKTVGVAGGEALKGLIEAF